ncbi:NAD(P)/FAD-dependent oxidoreductase [Synoicihabitans lomoniglobus]|uniref:FAD-dependent oxidoreductase n=1 Tax=Synoicihabitans lomoniglobus TaxID=2909285 RepID=A0AAE9ZWH3_9BACT|nr:FAD-binding oxidoreductase [Opitutaceae bacterium LMO-M01]WED64706.1 FAD-dependent oxidoreductase [Opitutaceae bacterium LMO-M01]
MDLISGTPFWPLRDGLLATYSPLPGDRTADVAVIGAGITGALAADRLARAGHDVVVLDRREAARGSTAASTALLQYEIDTPLADLAERHGWEEAAAAYQDCRDAVQALRELAGEVGRETDFKDKASLLLASNQDHVPRLRREFEARQRAGFRVHWLEEGDLRERSSLPHPAGLLTSRRDAAQVDAHALAHGLLRRAQAAGAGVHDRTAVTSWRRTGGRIVLHTDREAVVRAKCVVVATGFEAGPFLPRQVMELNSTYAMVTEPLPERPGLPTGEPLIWETRQPYCYMRTTADGRLLAGGYDDPFRDPAERDRRVPEKTRLLERKLRRWFPEIPRIEADWTWAGTFAETKDGLPYIGEHVSRSGFWFALGYGGNGITYSQIAARLLDQRLRGEPDEADERRYRFKRK